VDTYVLYGGGVTRALGPQMVLEEADLSYELRELDECAGDHRKPEYLAINPAGYIPALVTPDGTVLHEAAAIMVFLAEHHERWDMIPAPGSPLRGRFFCRLFFQTNDIQPAVRQFFKPEQYSADPTHAPDIKLKARRTVMDRWSVLNGYLENEGPYNLGDQFSLADMHMTLWAAYGLQSPDTVLDAFPAVRKCFELTADRPKIRPLIAALQASIADW